MRKLLAYFARRSRKVEVQVALATLHGLIAIFGFGRALLIVNTMRKKGLKRAHRPKV